MLKAIKDSKWSVRGSIVVFKKDDSMDSLSLKDKNDAIKYGYAVDSDSKSYNPVQENKAITQVEENKQFGDWKSDDEPLSEAEKEKIAEEAEEIEAPDDEVKSYEKDMEIIEVGTDKPALLEIAARYEVEGFEDLNGRNSTKTIKEKLEKHFN